MRNDNGKNYKVKLGPGRPRGSKNKLTNIKDEFLFCYQIIGGLGGLTAWAKKKENRTKFYEMLTKLFPREIRAEINIGRSISEYTTEELVEIVTGGKRTDTPEAIH